MNDASRRGPRTNSRPTQLVISPSSSRAQFRRSGAHAAVVQVASTGHCWSRRPSSIPAQAKANATAKPRSPCRESADGWQRRVLHTDSGHGRPACTAARVGMTIREQREEQEPESSKFPTPPSSAREAAAADDHADRKQPPSSSSGGKSTTAASLRARPHSRSRDNTATRNRFSAM